MLRTENFPDNFTQIFLYYFICNNIVFLLKNPLALRAPLLYREGAKLERNVFNRAHYIFRIKYRN